MLRRSVQITPYGIDYVEEALAKPDQPTEFFPAVNVLHIEHVVNSQIQQGTVHSHQTANWKGASPDQIASIISDLEALAKTSLTDAQRRDVEANTGTLEAQAKGTKPNDTIMREALVTLRGIAEKVGASLLAAKIGALLGQ